MHTYTIRIDHVGNSVFPGGAACGYELAAGARRARIGVDVPDSGAVLREMRILLAAAGDLAERIRRAGKRPAEYRVTVEVGSRETAAAFSRGGGYLLPASAERQLRARIVAVLRGFSAYTVVCPWAALERASGVTSEPEFLARWRAHVDRVQAGAARDAWYATRRCETQAAGGRGTPR